VLAVRGLALRAGGQAARIGDAQLLGDPVCDDMGHVGWAGEERAEESHGAQLHGEAEAVVIAAAAVDQRAVAVVEVKEPIELRCRWRLVVAAVGGELAAAQEIDRHGPSAPRVLRPLVTPRRLAPWPGCHPR
jgi:hypothetical protein